MPKKIYYCEVTEYERGWGCRPDGYLITLEKANGEQFAKKSDGKIWHMNDWSEFSVANLDWKLGLINSSVLMRELMQSEYRTKWVNEKTFEELVEV